VGCPQFTNGLQTKCAFWQGVIKEHHTILYDCSSTVGFLPQFWLSPSHTGQAPLLVFWPRLQSISNGENILRVTYFTLVIGTNINLSFLYSPAYTHQVVNIGIYQNWWRY